MCVKSPRRAQNITGSKMIHLLNKRFFLNQPQPLPSHQPWVLLQSQPHQQCDARATRVSAGISRQWGDKLN